MPVVNTQLYDSPCGELLLAAVEDELCLCDWTNSRRAETNRQRVAKSLDAKFVNSDSEVLNKTINELNEYFAGERRTFDIPLRLVGTAFQTRVWNALLAIPYDARYTYLYIAKKIGKPKAVRAVAQAIGANGISILVPCHRIIGSDSSLTGYAGGVKAKQWLLDLERKFNGNYPQVQHRTAIFGTGVA